MSDNGKVLPIDEHTSKVTAKPTCRRDDQCAGQLVAKGSIAEVAAEPASGGVATVMLVRRTHLCSARANRLANIRGQDWVKGEPRSPDA